MTETIDQASIWIQACTEWIEEHVKSGSWLPFYATFMFEPLPGSPAAVVAQMHKAVEKKWYGQFCTKFARDPHAENEQERLPRLWLFPDKPTWKRDSKLSVHDVKFNDNGLHFNGPLLLPRFSRFQEGPLRHFEGPLKHFEQNQSKYARRGIRRIHVKPMTNMRELADYAAKTLKSARVDEAHILILPRASSEVAGNTVRQLNPKEKAIKDIQAATNTSPEVASALYDRILKKEGPHRR